MALDAGFRTTVRHIGLGGPSTLQVQVQVAGSVD